MNEEGQMWTSAAHLNPVKAGLTDVAEGWMYSSASDWISGRSGPLKVDKDFGWL